MPSDTYRFPALPVDPRSAWYREIHRQFEVGNLTRFMRDVLIKLYPFFSCPEGAFPSHGRLAGLARCSVSTVQRALSRARELGMLVWEQRRRGRRRFSNLYRIVLPVGPAVRRWFGRLFSTGQRDRGKMITKEKKGLQEVGVVAARAALADIARRRAAQLGFSHAPPLWPRR